MSEIFGNPDETKPTETPTPETPSPNDKETKPVETPPDPNTYFADQLVGIKDRDGRQKYATVQDALGSIPHAQAKIDELYQQTKQLEQELNQRKGMEEMVAALQPSTPQAELPPVQGLDEASVAQIVNNQLQQNELQKTLSENRAKVQQELAAKFGDKAKEAFTKKAEELGISFEVFESLAIEHPQVALAHFKDVPSQEPTPIQGTVVTDGVRPQEVERKPVMRGATSKDLVEQFRAHAQS